MALCQTIHGGQAPSEKPCKIIRLPGCWPGAMRANMPMATKNFMSLIKDNAPQPTFQSSMQIKKHCFKKKSPRRGCTNEITTHRYPYCNRLPGNDGSHRLDDAQKSQAE